MAVGHGQTERIRMAIRWRSGSRGSTPAWLVIGEKARVVQGPSPTAP